MCDKKSNIRIETYHEKHLSYHHHHHHHQNVNSKCQLESVSNV